MNSKFSIRMIPWEIKDLVFSNNICAPYIIVHFHDTCLRGGYAPFGSQLEELSPPGFPSSTPLVPIDSGLIHACSYENKSNGVKSVVKLFINETNITYR